MTRTLQSICDEKDFLSGHLYRSWSRLFQLITVFGISAECSFLHCCWCGFALKARSISVPVAAEYSEAGPGTLR